MQGIKNLRADDATRLAGEDPEHAQRDLYEAIERKDFPKWKFSVQVMAEAEADAFAKSTGWNPFDLTKVWQNKDYPLIEVEPWRSEEHTSELQSLMRISYVVFCLKETNKKQEIQSKQR